MPQAPNNWTNIDAIDVTTLGDLLLRGAKHCPGRDCIVFPDQRLTYRELADRAARRARSLIGMGVRKGEHVAIFLPTCIELAEVLFGIALAGAVPVLINARYQGAELAYLIENSDSVVVFSTGAVAENLNLMERLREAIGHLDGQNPRALGLGDFPKLRSIVQVDGKSAGVLSGEEFDRFAELVSFEEFTERRSQVRLRDIGLILYTSGTTSHPKGCLLSQEAVVRNGIELARRYEMTSEDKFFSPLPMYHIAATMPIVAVLYSYSTYVTMKFFDAGVGLRICEQEKATISYLCFATFIQDTINHPDFSKTDLSRLRLMNSSVPMQAADTLSVLMAKELPHVFQVSTYGLSECAGTVTTSRLTDTYEERMTRLGGAFPGLEVRIVDDHDNDVPAGQRGEILVRGYSILDAYYKDAEKTEKALKGGWLHTGDIGSLDDKGHLMFHGRNKEMLKVGGENVAALEVESFIGNHPAVKLCQVVGCPEPRMVEVVAAFIELKPGMTTTQDEIIAFCRGRISSFKVPRYVRFVEEWPIGASKIQKFKLRDALMEELGIDAFGNKVA